MRRTRVLSWMTALGVLGTIASCASPTPTVPAAPVLPPTVTITALSIVGMPASVSYGQSVQLGVMATLPDGAQKQAADVVWQSSDSAVATVSGDGLVRVTGVGGANITARVQGLEGTARVSVAIPPAPVARLDVTIDHLGSVFAIGGLTDVAFDTSSSTGAGLRYEFDFGDGSPVTDTTSATANHVFEPLVGLFPKEHVVRATVTDVMGRTDSATRTVKVEPLSWLLIGGGFGSFWNDPKDDHMIHWGSFTKLPHVDGQYFGTGTSSHTFTGTLDRDGALHLVLDDGTVLDGWIVRDGIKVPRASFDSHLKLKVRGGPDDGALIKFYLYDSYYY